MAATSGDPIGTLVFMHCKATDNSKAGGNLRITEMYMLAVNRKQFLSKAHNKCENGIKLSVIPEEGNEETASESPGPTAEKEKPKTKQECLDETALELLRLFLYRLKKPVCIVAHAGKSYDFRFLKAFLNQVQTELMPDLLYADTLEGFKVIEKKNLETQMENLSLKCSSPDSSNKATEMFKLQVIYERHVGKFEGNVHSTESNVHMIYKIALKNAKAFMDWVDKKAHK